MANPFENYKTFIDGLLEWPRTSVSARWVSEWDMAENLETYRIPADNPLQRLVPRLKAEQREALCELLQSELDEGIHQTLTYLEPYTIVKDGVPLAIGPFGTEIHYDFIARRDGSEWPSDHSDEE